MSAGAAELTFNIVEGRLNGLIDGVFINSVAHSGGRGGSKTPGVQAYFLDNNPFATGVKLKKGDKASIGGTLPMGSYTLSIHETRPNMIRLTPVSTGATNRDGLLIHGRGKRGSDGCIVPSDFHVVLKLCELVKARQLHAQPPIVLDVIAVGSNVDRKLREWRSTA